MHKYQKMTYILVHTHIHMYVDIYTHTRTHTHLRACVHTHIHTHFTDAISIHWWLNMKQVKVIVAAIT